jgi:beta-lactam-binding protein with PASTA domain
MEDDTPIDFSAPGEMTEQAAKAAEATPVQSQPQAPNVTMTMDEGGDIAVPDFKGKTMREVADTCMRLGLNPVLVGSSLALQQTPAAGSSVRRGAKIRVEFGTPPAHAGKVH